MEVGIQNFFGVEFENKLQKENVDGLSVEVEEGDLIPAGLMSTDWRLDAVVSQLLKEVFLLSFSAVSSGCDLALAGQSTS